MTIEAKATPRRIGSLILHGTGVESTTITVQEDEPCFFLGEFEAQSPDFKGTRRYQMLKVVRKDRLVTAYIDLGPAKSFKADCFTMAGGVVDENGRGEAFHTVKELQDGALELRNRKPRREWEPLDLQTAWLNHVEEKQRRRKHQSTFGRKGQLVRA